nr:ribonuclease HII [Bacillus alkalicellulosilyticus]
MKTIKEIEASLFSEEVSVDFVAELKLDDRLGVQKLVERYEKQKQKEQELHDDFIAMMTYEQTLFTQGVTYIAGVDEVGRGPLAGPVVSAAVILPVDFYLPGLTDSKKLTKAKRDAFYDVIMDKALAVGIASIPAQTIDDVNIYQATIKAMCEAIQALQTKPEHLLVDAMKLPLAIPQTSIIKGDQKSISIAASSVIAKVTRDRYMENLGKKFPQYRFEGNMGYGTKDHLKAIHTYGIIEEHRKSFSPITELTENRLF